MAFLLKQLTGTASGKVGNLIYRARKNGVSIISIAPEKYRKTKEIGAINNRSRFSILIKFASAVIKLNEIKYLWNSTYLAGRAAYTKIIKFNHEYASKNYLNSDSVFVPPNAAMNSTGNKIITKTQANFDYTNFEINSVNIEDETLDLKFTPSDKINVNIDSPLTAVAFLHMYNPIILNSKQPPPYSRFLYIAQKLQSFNLISGDVCSFKFNKVGNSYKIINDYNIVTLYFTMIFNDVDKMKWLCSPGFIYKGADVYENLVAQGKSSSGTTPSINDNKISEDISVKLI